MPPVVGRPLPPRHGGVQAVGPQGQGVAPIRGEAGGQGEGVRRALRRRQAGVGGDGDVRHVGDRAVEGVPLRGGQVRGVRVSQALVGGDGAGHLRRRAIGRVGVRRPGVRRQVGVRRVGRVGVGQALVRRDGAGHLRGRAVGRVGVSGASVGGDGRAELRRRGVRGVRVGRGGVVGQVGVGGVGTQGRRQLGVRDVLRGDGPGGRVDPVGPDLHGVVGVRGGGQAQGEGVRRGLHHRHALGAGDGHVRAGPAPAGHRGAPVAPGVVVVGQPAQGRPQPAVAQGARLVLVEVVRGERDRDLHDPQGARHTVTKLRSSERVEAPPVVACRIR